MRTTTTLLTVSILLLLVAGCSGESPKPVEAPPPAAAEPAPAEPAPEPAAEAASPEPMPVEEPAAAPEASPATFATNAPEGSWRLVAFGDATEVGEVQVTLEARVDRSIGGKSGCNSYAGEWTIEAGRARVGPLAGTKMACPPPMMEVETRYLKEMEKAAGWRPHVDGIVLVDPEGTPLLVFAKREASAG